MAVLSFPEAIFQLPKFEDAHIAKFQGFGFNTDTAVSTFNFSFTSCFLLLFLSRFFFFFAGYLLAFILVRKVSRKLLVSQDLMEGRTGG